MPAPLVVFDLDGTLVDTAPDLVTTLNTIFARQGLPQIGYAAGRNMVGGGARMMIERGLTAAGRVVAPGDLDQLVAEFIDHYANHIAEHSRPFPGVEAALDTLSARGLRLAVCTNKLEWLSVRLLQALGLAQRFVAICGPDTFQCAKPDPRILQCTIAKCEADGRPTVMVGDSATDIATARAAGIPVIAVDFGYTDVAVQELGPDRVIGKFEDLPEAVFGLLGCPEGEFARNS